MCSIPAAAVMTEYIRSSTCFYAIFMEIGHVDGRRHVANVEEVVIKRVLVHRV